MEFLLAVQLVLTIVVLIKLAAVGRRAEELRAQVERVLDLLRRMLAGSQATGTEPDRGSPPPVPPQLWGEPSSTVAGAPIARAPQPLPPPKPPSEPPPVPPPVGRPRAQGAAKAVSPPAAPEPPEWVGRVQAVLLETWNWLLFNDRKGRGDVSLEYALASTWLPRLGIVAIVACVAYFLAWSIERGLIGELARTIITFVFGVGMVAAGVRLLGKKYDIIGQGFLGGGVVTLYFSAWAAGPLFHLVPYSVAFVFMGLVTVVAGALAVGLNSLLVAVIGLIGGYATPMLLSQPEHAVLYSYLLVLSCGILGVAHFRQWHLLNYMGFVATYVLFVASFMSYGRDLFGMTVAFLSAIFVVHSGIVYWYNVARRAKTSALEIIHLLANAGVYAFFAYWLIRDAHGAVYPAVMTVVLSAFFAVHVVVFLRRGLHDRLLLTAFVGLAALFAALTLPIVFDKESLTIAFALLSFLLLWLARAMGSSFLRNASYVAYVITLFRLLGLDLQRHFWLGAPSAAQYWGELGQRLWTYGAAIASVCAAFVLHRRESNQEEGVVAPENDVPGLLPRSVGLHIFYWCSIAVVFLYLHHELNAMFGCVFVPFRLPILTLLWCLMALFFVREFTRGALPTGIAAAAIYVCAFGGLVKLLTVDLAGWQLDARYVYGIGYAPVQVLARAVDFGAIMAVFVFVWWLMLRRDIRARAAIFGWTSLALFFFYSTLEINSLLFWKLRLFQRGGVTVLWAVFAIAFTSIGIWRLVRGLRYAGLALFLVVFGKIMLVDLRGMPAIYRVIAFFAIGVAMLLGAFAYVFADKRFKLLHDADEPALKDEETHDGDAENEER